MRTLRGRLARPYPLGIFALALILLVQPWGLTAADTKHDLAANPLHFLHGALSAYTDTFTPVSYTHLTLPTKRIV